MHSEFAICDCLDGAKRKPIGVCETPHTMIESDPIVKLGDVAHILLKTRIECDCNTTCCPFVYTTKGDGHV